MKTKAPEFIQQNGRASIMRFFSREVFTIHNSAGVPCLCINKDNPKIKLLILKENEKQRFTFFEN